MPSDKFVAYYCASRGRKVCKPGSLELQRAAVMSFINRSHRTLLERHTEDARPGELRKALIEALAACRQYNAALIVGDPERLERDDGFLDEIRKSGVECWAVDSVSANPVSTERPHAKPLETVFGGTCH
ncbi:MAG: hypothetical protein WCF85_04880 [Rhodospirillaceae bacterium]